MTMDLSGYVPKKTTIKIGTREFIFTEISIFDLALFKAYLMGQREALNAKRRERLLKDAQGIGNIDPLELLKYTDSSVSEEEFAAEMESIEGVGYLAYLSLKYHYPEINKEQAAQIVTPATLEQVTKAMFPPIKGAEQGAKKNEVVKPKESPNPQQ